MHILHKLIYNLVKGSITTILVLECQVIFVSYF